MPRPTLRQRCIKDQAVLRFIVETARKSAAADECATLQVTFFTQLACDIIAAVPRVNESLAGSLLPAVRAGLARSASNHMRASACSVLAFLATNTTFSTQLISEMMELATKNGEPADLEQVLLLLRVLCSSQPTLRSFPDKALKHLVKYPNLVAELVALSHLKVDIRHLLDAVLPSLASSHPARSEHTPNGTQEAILIAIFDQVTVEPSTAQAVAEALIRAALLEDDTASERAASLSRILRTICRKHADKVDAALNDVLTEADIDGNEAFGTSSRQQRSARLAPLLWAGLSGAAYAPLPDGSTTLALAVDAASVQTRILALQELDCRAKEAVETSNGEEPRQDLFLTQALLRRLNDDSMKVAAVAVGLSSISLLPRAAVFDAFETLMRRSTAILARPPGAKLASKSDRKHARALARQILRALAAATASGCPESFKGRAAALVLEGLLAGNDSQLELLDEKVSAAALLSAKSLDHPLLNGLSSVLDASTAVAGSQGKLSAIVAALAQQLAENNAAKDSAALLLTTASHGARLLIAAAALHACSVNLSGCQELCSTALMAPLLKAIAAFPADLPSHQSELFDVNNGHLPSHEFLGIVRKDQQTVLVTTLRTLLLHVLQGRPAASGTTLQETSRTFKTVVGFKPAAAYQLHLDALLSQIGAVTPPLNFLATVFGGVPLRTTTTLTNLQVRSLQLFTATVATTADSTAAQKSAAGASLAALLPHLLAALSSGSIEVRAAALEQLDDTSPLLAVARQAPSGVDKLEGEHFCALLGALAHVGADIRRDSEAAVMFLGESIAESQQQPNSSPTPDAPFKGQKKSSGGAPLMGPLQLTAAAATAIAKFLSSRLQLLRAPSDAAAASATLRALRQWQTPAARLLAAVPLLKHVAPRADDDDTEYESPPFFDILDDDDTPRLPESGGASPLISELDVRMAEEQQTSAGFQRQILCCSLLRLYTAEAIQEASEICPSDGGISKSIMNPFISIGWGLGQGLPGTPMERVAARQMVTPEMHAALSSTDQRRVFLGVLWGSMSDTDPGARAAAKDAVSQLPLRFETIRQMLDGLAALASLSPPTGATPATARKRTRRAAGATTSASNAIPGVEVLDAAVAAMETLMWKAVGDERGALIATLCRCLRALAAACTAAGTIAADLRDDATAGSESDADEDSDLDGADMEDDATAPRVTQLSLAMGLCLSVLEKLAAMEDTSAEGATEVRLWDVPAVLMAARAAVDPVTRRLALRLLSTLARWKPAAALDYVMEVIAFAGSAAAADQDSDASFAAATEALLAVFPAWLAADGSAEEAVAAVINAALSLPHHKQLPLLTALYAALPEETALSTVLLELVSASQSSCAQLATTTPDSDGLPDATAPQLPDIATQAAQGLDLAASIACKATELQRARAFVAMIESAQAEQEGADNHQRLNLVLLITAQQLARIAPSTERQLQQVELDSAYATLLRLSLKHASGGSVGSGHGVVAAAQLVGSALREVMTPAAHATAIVSLAADEQVSERLRRKALKLLAADATACAEAVADAETGDRAAAGPAVEAALSFAPLLSEYFVATGSKPAMSAMTRQAALAAFGSLARSLGPIRPGPLGRAAPAVITALKDGHRAVRSSALVTAGALLHGIGNHAVQLLPQMAPAILFAASTAIAAIATDAASAHAGVVSGEGGAIKSKTRRGSKGQMCDSGGDNAAALEAAAALAAIVALVRSLPKFISPYLPAILQLCLNPVVWGSACEASGASSTSEALRRLLPNTVPLRLLLPPLINQWAATKGAGAVPMAKLLGMLTSLINSSTPTSVGTHADTVFRFLLPALDVRQTHCGKLSEADMLSVESAAVAALEAMTLKLSERIFKPLFLRTVEWARAPGAPSVSDSGEKSTGSHHSTRPAVLFAISAALTRRMQSIFVPYFRYLLDPLVAALEAGTHLSTSHRPSKRRKSASTAAPPDTAAATADSEGEAIVSFTRMQALSALEQCFLHEGGSFMDDSRFQRLLPPLVAQLTAGPAPSVANTSAAPTASTLAAILPQEVSAEANTWGPAANGGLSAADDPFGIMAVATLVRFASAAGSDTRHRPLNRAVLNMTRGGDLRTRRRSLAVTHGIVSVLREEYALLLPESLPFLSELLEDEDAEVATSTAALVTRLEELTGEGLDQHLKT